MNLGIATLILAMLPLQLIAQLEVRVTPFPFVGSLVGLTDVFSAYPRDYTSFDINAPISVYSFQISNKNKVFFRSSWLLISHYAEDVEFPKELIRKTDFEYERAIDEYLTSNYGKNLMRFPLNFGREFWFAKRLFVQLGMANNLTYRPMPQGKVFLSKYDRYDVEYDHDFFGDRYLVTEKTSALQITKYRLSYFSFNSGLWFAFGWRMRNYRLDIHAALCRDLPEKFIIYKARYSHESENFWTETYYQKGGYDLTFGATLMYSFKNK